MATHSTQWTGQPDADHIAELSRALAGTVEPIRAALEANHGLEPPRR